MINAWKTVAAVMILSGLIAITAALVLWLPWLVLAIGAVVVFALLWMAADEWWPD